MRFLWWRDVLTKGRAEDDCVANDADANTNTLDEVVESQSVGTFAENRRAARAAASRPKRAPLYSIVSFAGIRYNVLKVFVHLLSMIHYALLFRS